MNNIKIEALEELRESCKKDECTCKGEMFLCVRCAMINDLDEELKELKSFV